MIAFVPLGPLADGEQVYEIRLDGEPGHGHIVAEPRIVETLEAMRDVAITIWQAAHYGETP